MPTAASAVRKGTGVGEAGQPTRADRKAPGDGPPERQRGHGTGRHGWPVERAEHHDILRPGSLASHLDPDGADESLGVRLAQHREVGREAVAPASGQAGRHALHARGRPARAGARPAAPPGSSPRPRSGRGTSTARGRTPLSAAASRRRASRAPCPLSARVVGAGARGTTGAAAGDVDLVDRIERAAAWRASRQVRPGEKPAPATTATPRSVASGAELEQRPARRRARQSRTRPGGRGRDGARAGVHVGAVGTGEQHAVDRPHGGAVATVARLVAGARHDRGARAPRPRRRSGPGRPLVPRRAGGPRVRRPLPPPRAGSSSCRHGHQRRSGPESSRHPPCWGGVPPVPRRRSTRCDQPGDPEGDEGSAQQGHVDVSRVVAGVRGAGTTRTCGPILIRVAGRFAPGRTSPAIAARPPAPSSRRRRQAR